MRGAILVLLYLASFSLIGALAWHGRGYYALPLVERPRHPLHWELKPGGELGRLYGIAGLTTMAVMLVYSVRKRAPVLRRAGSLAGWLDFHIWCGIVGPLWILLHSALKVGGLIAIAFWSMIAVALSGVLGRFLYAQLPRTSAGDELSLQEARRLDAELAARLERELGVSPRELAELVGEPGEAQLRSLTGALVSLALEPLRFRRRLARFRRAHRAAPRAALVRIARVARDRALLQRRLGLWQRLHELFHYWHVAHKPFALLMYLFAAVHVAVAWATGYALGGR